MKIATKSQENRRTYNSVSPLRHGWRFQTGKMMLVITSSIFVLFLTLPVIALMVRGLTLGNWEEIPTSIIPDAILLSGFTTAITVIINFAAGIPLAYVLARWDFPLKNLVTIGVQLPIVLPPAVAGLALLLTFGRNGFLGPTFAQFGVSIPFTTAAVILAQVFVSAPFFIRTAAAGFANIDDEIEDAARVDGASGWQIFRLITFPLARRTLIAGILLSWARALGEFGATILFAGSLTGKTQTMPLLVYNVLERDLNAAILTAVLLIIMALAALALSGWLLRGDQTSI